MDQIYELMSDFDQFILEQTVHRANLVCDNDNAIGKLHLAVGFTVGNSFSQAKFFFLGPLAVRKE
jgi:hypothetical protein